MTDGKKVPFPYVTTSRTGLSPLRAPEAGSDRVRTPAAANRMTSGDFPGRRRTAPQYGLCRTIAQRRRPPLRGARPGCVGRNFHLGNAPDSGHLRTLPGELRGAECAPGRRAGLEGDTLRRAAA